MYVCMYCYHTSGDTQTPQPQGVKETQAKDSIKEPRQRASACIYRPRGSRQGETGPDDQDEKGPSRGGPWHLFAGALRAVDLVVSGTHWNTQPARLGDMLWRWCARCHVATESTLSPCVRLGLPSRDRGRGMLEPAGMDGRAGGRGCGLVLRWRCCAIGRGLAFGLLRLLVQDEFCSTAQCRVHELLPPIPPFPLLVRRQIGGWTRWGSASGRLRAFARAGGQAHDMARPDVKERHVNMSVSGLFRDLFCRSAWSWPDGGSCSRSHAGEVKQRDTKWDRMSNKPMEALP